MAVEQRFMIRENDYGHQLHFYLTVPDGSAYSIPGGATITFECYKDGATSLTVTDTTHVTLVEATDGHVYYTVQSGDFGADSSGTYWCRIKVNTITSEEAKLVVKDEYGDGA